MMGMDIKKMKQPAARADFFEIVFEENLDLTSPFPPYFSQKSLRRGEVSSNNADIVLRSDTFEKNSGRRTFSQ